MTIQQATIIQNLTNEVEKEGAHARPEAASTLFTFTEFVAIFEKLTPPPVEQSPSPVETTAVVVLPDSSSSPVEESSSSSEPAGA